MNIPIYRAKKIDSDEYVIGSLYFGKYIFQEHSGLGACIGIDRNDLAGYDIDSSTLSINFLDMIDSEGNKIFASLSEDGRGGDIIHNIIAPDSFGEMKVFWNRRRNAICYDEKGGKLAYLAVSELKNYKVIGIQEQM